MNIKYIKIWTIQYKDIAKISLNVKILFVYVEKDPFTNAIAISHLSDVMSP